MKCDALSGILQTRTLSLGDTRCLAQGRLASCGCAASENGHLYIKMGRRG